MEGGLKEEERDDDDMIPNRKWDVTSKDQPAVETNNRNEDEDAGNGAKEGLMWEVRGRKDAVVPSRRWEAGAAGHGKREQH